MESMQLLLSLLLFFFCCFLLSLLRYIYLVVYLCVISLLILTCQAYVNDELQRRVEAAVAETITIEQAKHDIALVQALGEQKDVLLTEKDHELILQKEDFQTQLAIEVSNAREEGKSAGLHEAREEGVKVCNATIGFVSLLFWVFFLVVLFVCLFLFFWFMFFIL
jgi:hypothetical protein